MFFCELEALEWKKCLVIDVTDVLKINWDVSTVADGSRLTTFIRRKIRKRMEAKSLQFL